MNKRSAGNVFSGVFIGQISSVIYQSLNKEQNKTDILSNAIEGTEEITRIEDVQAKGKELEQVTKEKQMTKENEERGIV